MFRCSYTVISVLNFVPAKVTNYENNNIPYCVVMVKLLVKCGRIRNLSPDYVCVLCAGQE